MYDANETARVIKNAETFGGSFEKALAKAIMYADGDNLERIQKAFPEIWKKFSEWDNGVLVKRVITDPCYIIDSERWSALIDQACQEVNPDEDSGAWSNKLSSLIEEELKEITGADAFACDTGFGDWSNAIVGPNIIQSEFCADAGMVCVCNYTDKVQKALADCGDHAYAIIEAKGKLIVDFDVTDANWTVVNIEDDDDNRWSTFHANKCDDDDDGEW